MAKRRKWGEKERERARTEDDLYHPDVKRVRCKMVGRGP